MERAVPSFSQAAIEALRDTEDFKKDTKRFDGLKLAICKRLSPRDVKPLLEAGMKEEELLTQLAFVVDRASSTEILGRIAEKSQVLKQLADKIERVTDEAAVAAYDPECDGRYWLALFGLLSWDKVPKPVVNRTQTLVHMRALACYLRECGQKLGELSQPLKKHNRNQDLRNLLAYVHHRTNGEVFDSEVAYLLTSAYKAAGQERAFSEGQIKKFRQRHLPNPQIPTRPTFGQRLAAQLK